MNYGELMDDIRFENEIKQKEMAKILGITPATYNAYEKQSLVIPSKYLIAFCDYFKISTDYILGISKERSYPNLKIGITKKEAGFRFRKFRKSLKLNQQKFSRILSISSSSLSAYEHGINFIPTTLIYEICKKYKVSSDYLLGRIDN